METRFHRWQSYGTYLGNDPDAKNDFAKRDTIKFTSGIQVKTAAIDGKAVVVIATQRGCLTRLYKRFDQPPIRYAGDCGPVPRSIAGQLALGEVVGILNRKALK
jgi:hypothetical protein